MVKQHIEPLFISCDCYSEGLWIMPDYWAHPPESPEDKLEDLDISFWSRGMGNPSNLRWKDRFRFIWQVLRHGRPYGDQVMFRKEKVIQLRDYLTKVIEDME